MINWLHTFHPQALVLTFGPINIYWYGLFMVTGIIVALVISMKLAKYYKVESDTLFDLAFWLIINGLIGARAYDVCLQLPYYLINPLDIFKIWQGGLAIHGGIFAGLITIYCFAKKHKIYFWKLCALIVPGLALAQAIGRWGNYFNQEIFGLPTSLPWAIPIDLINRPISYISSEFFQPTFLYESLGSLFIFFILFALNFYVIKNNKLKNNFYIITTTLYVLLYSILRFSLEFIRIDEAPSFLSIRWPQFISLILIVISIKILISHKHDKHLQA